jgi:hypothetical protein
MLLYGISVIISKVPTNIFCEDLHMTQDTATSYIDRERTRNQHYHSTHPRYGCSYRWSRRSWYLRSSFQIPGSREEINSADPAVTSPLEVDALCTRYRARPVIYQTNKRQHHIGIKKPCASSLESWGAPRFQQELVYDVWKLPMTASMRNGEKQGAMFSCQFKLLKHFDHSCVA